ncbi:PREDICTED: zinc finger BED domain-containing protein 6-like isoform X2 [Bactrocera latifrons]|uniref:zinc finger BED domain-containing protein 6-like isoform X2 n=1 Tax=Bactrocera latifrons TaxID=174628 RepID=UPI0008DDE0EF|nr:PREDICTED: zinc finger BED domain-containing protein 6-like isoform X2 [Bactrocera latifrons]
MRNRHPRAELPGAAAVQKIGSKQTENPDAQHEVTETNVQYEPVLRQSTITAGICNMKISAKAKKEIDDCQMPMLFIKDLQPFSIVEDSGFVQFVKALNPSYELPSRHVVSRTIIPALYEACVEKVKLKVANVVKFCFTTDCWTSRNSM